MKLNHLYLILSAGGRESGKMIKEIPDPQERSVAAVGSVNGLIPDNIFDSQHYIKSVEYYVNTFCIGESAAKGSFVELYKMLYCNKLCINSFSCLYL